MLSYVPPTSKQGKISVSIEEDDIRSQTEYWKHALIGYVIGDTPYLMPLEAYIMNVWKCLVKPQVLGHDDGYFIFRLESAEECDRILLGGPYTFHNKPFIVQTWDIDFYFDPNCITTIPQWVTFPGLPVGYWSCEALSKVASAIGKPKHTDQFTATMERISYARVLIETDVAQPLLDVIEMITPTGVSQQSVEYEWKPKNCGHCLKFGHTSEGCYAKEKDKNHEAETFKETPKKKRRNRRKKRTQQQQ